VFGPIAATKSSAGAKFPTGAVGVSAQGKRENHAADEPKEVDGHCRRRSSGDHPIKSQH
jgi:hypothetical protein